MRQQLSYVIDWWQLAKELSPGRLINVLKLYGSFTFSRLTRRIIHRGAPWAVAIEPTTVCNLRCPECQSGKGNLTRNHGSMTIERFKAIMQMLPKSTMYLTLYFQGEPMLHPNFYEMVRHARQRRLYVSTSTNGHFLNDQQARQTVESGLSRIIISLDGVDENTYSRYRVGGDFETVTKGIENLVRWKSALRVTTPLIVIQFLVFRYNQDQISKMRTLVNKLKADVFVIKSAQHYDLTKENPLIATRSQYSRYVKLSDGSFRPKNASNTFCWRSWSTCVITWDGKILPCCYDKDAQHSYGTLKEGNFNALWNSPTAWAFRKQLKMNRKSVDICSNCNER